MVPSEEVLNDPLLPPKSHPQEVLEPSGEGRTVEMMGRCSMMPLRTLFILFRSGWIDDNYQNAISTVADRPLDRMEMEGTPGVLLGARLSRLWGIRLESKYESALIRTQVRKQAQCLGQSGLEHGSHVFFLLFFFPCFFPVRIFVGPLGQKRPVRTCFGDLEANYFFR